MATVESQPHELYQRIWSAIRRLRTGIRWKPGKDTSHLRTRIAYGHLLDTATLTQYEQIIRNIILDDSAAVYGYFWQQDVYPTVAGLHQGRRWLVMFSLDGVMETAFPPDDPDEYLADDRFRFLGKMQELMK